MNSAIPPEDPEERRLWKIANFGKNYGRSTRDSTEDPLKVQKPYTPDEFLAAMDNVLLKNTYVSGFVDWEGAHGEADDLMQDQLQRLGFTSAMEVYSTIKRW